MTEFTKEKLAELRAVAETATYRAEPLADDVLELLDALEAKTAELDAKADYVSDLEERVRQRDNHVIPVLHARIKEAERERDEARAMYDRDLRNAKAARDQIAEMERDEKARADRAEAALERVKVLHTKVAGCPWCDECGAEYSEWPCATMKAIQGAEE